MSSKNYKPTMTRVVEARKEGQYVRANTFSKKGKSKCPKLARRKVKRELMNH